MLYHADNIISLRSSDLKTEYVQGVDYVLADGKLRILNGSTIKRVPYEKMYPKQEIQLPEGERLFNTKDGKGFVWIEGGVKIHNMQLAVTYRHSDSFKGKLPENQAKRLPKTMDLLQSGKPVKLLIYGDSISVGDQSTALYNTEPFAPTWFNMFAEELRNIGGKREVTVVNHSVGGTSSAWGAENAKKTAAEKADLAIIAFGMNDGSGEVKKSKYIYNTIQIMAAVQAQNPDCEFILISTMLPNPKSSFDTGLHEQYRTELLKLAQKGVAVADVTEMHRQILVHKRYEDFSGNNINHPNDYMARIYAQVLFDTVQ